MRITAISESTKELLLLAWLLASNGCNAGRRAAETPALPGRSCTIQDTCTTRSPEKYRDEIAKDMSDAQAAGINGTPTFVIGRTVGEDVDGIRVVGAQSYATFEAKLKDLLNAQ
jgi:protein-disulfide isomerase